MKYELEKIDSLIENLLDPPTGLENGSVQKDMDSMVLDINKESKRIKRSLSYHMFCLKNDKQVERYIQRHQSCLIRLCNSLIQQIPSEKFNYKNKTIQVSSLPELRFYFYTRLEEILSYIEKYFGKYFNQEELIPGSYRIIGQLEFREKLANIGTPDNCEQLQIALYPIRDFISQNTNISFRKLIYLKELFKEVSTSCTKCKQQKVDCKLGCSLIYLNFNSFKYFTFLTTVVKEDVSKEKEITKQIERLSFHLKKLNQAHSKPNYVFKPKQQSIKNQVSSWILEELAHLEKIHQLSMKFPQGTIEELDKNFKLSTELSVPQVAYFIRILVETGFIQNRNQKEVITFFAKHIKTRRAEKISTSSLHSKYYNIEEGTKESIRELVIKLLNETQKQD